MNNRQAAALTTFVVGMTVGMIIAAAAFDKNPIIGAVAILTLMLGLAICKTASEF